MMSELDLNTTGGASATNGGKNPTLAKHNSVATLNNKLQQHYQHNGELSSTELEEEDEALHFRYNDQGQQALCVSDLPRMRRNSDHGRNSLQSLNPSHSHPTNRELQNSYSLQYEPPHNYNFEQTQDPQSSCGQLQQMSMVDNENNSSNSASPLATSEQIFLPNGAALSTNSSKDKMGVSYMNVSMNKANHQSDLIDVETTQLNPELYSLQSHDEADVMMTSSASLHLHHLHQYHQNQNLEVSSR